MQQKLIKMLETLIRLIYRIEIVGQENINLEGSVIFAGKHNHSLDPVFVMTLLKRQVSFLAKKELFKNKLFAKVLNYFNVISLDRDIKDLKALKRALEVLKHNGALGIFPEGTRNGIEKGKEIAKGTASIAMLSNAPVVPFNIIGTFKPFSKMYILLGKPLYLEKKTDKELGTNMIMNAILDLKIPTEENKLLLKRSQKKEAY